MKALLVVFIACCLRAGFAQQRPSEFTKRPIPAVPTSVPPVIDGDLSDGAWKAAPKAETFVDRVTNAIAKDQSVAQITYDDKYIYIAYHCLDSEPDKVEARETIRDSKYASLSNGDNPNREDNVTVAIDTYNTKKATDVCVFSVNALGTPSAQIAGGRGGKIEWKGAWDSAAKRTPDGYSVEMRIPWQMLNYPASKKPITMGIDFFRYQYHTKTETVWSNVTPMGFTDLEGLWLGVNVPQTVFKPKLSLLPYVLPGIRNGDFTFRSGVDARLTLTQDLTAVGSLNPDFNTIEGAVEGIAFSRRERFIPERRPFFLEGSSYFNSSTRFNDIGAFFYARRIPTFDFGTKVYGKLTPVDSIGLQNTVTFDRRMDTVFRYKRDLTATSDAGIFLSDKTASNDRNNVAVFDQHARFGAYSFESQWGQSWGPGAGGGLAVLSANYQHANNISLVQYHTISDRFRAADGFIPYSGYHGWYGFTDFQSFWRNGAWRGYDYGVYGLAWDHMDGSRYQRSAGAFASLISRDDIRYSLSEDYAIVDGQVDSTVTVGFRSGLSNRFRQWGADIQTGRLASRPATFITPSASVRLFKHLDVSYAGALLNLEGVTRQHILTMSYELSPTRSFGGRLVAQDSDTNWYLSYRNSGGKGTDFYVIVGDPNARRFQRQLQLKMVFAF